MALDLGAASASPAVSKAKQGLWNTYSENAQPAVKDLSLDERTSLNEP